MLVRAAATLARRALGVLEARRAVGQQRRTLAALVRPAATLAGQAVAVERAGSPVGQGLRPRGGGQDDAGGRQHERPDERFPRSSSLSPGAALRDDDWGSTRERPGAARDLAAAAWGRVHGGRERGARRRTDHEGL